MAISLYDHHRRIEDLEAALDALRRLIVDSAPQKAAVTEAARKLRVSGRSGAAALLEGAALPAAYRK
jgi:hypothetical protein